MQSNYSKRRIVFLAVSLLALLVFAGYFLNNSILIIERPGNAEDADLVIKKQGSTDEIKARYGINLLPNGEYSVELSSGLSLNKKLVDVRTFRVAKTHGNMLPQKQAKKVARGSNECIFGSAIGMEKGELFSLDCQNPSTIFRNFQKNYSTKEPFIELSNVVLVESTPYKDGLASLGLAEGAVSLIYTTQSGQIIRKISEITGEANSVVESFKLAVDEGGAYVLDADNASVLVFRGPDLAVEKMDIKVPEKISGKQVSFKAYGGRYYLLIADVSEESQGDDLGHGNFYVFSNGSSAPVTTAEVGELSNDLFDFNVIDKNLISATSLSRDTSVYRISERKLRLEKTIDKTFGSAVIDKSLYLLINGDIFSYNHGDKTLNLEFGAEKIIVTKIQTVHNRLVFNGVAKTETEPTNQTYILKSGKVAENKRLEDFLPYGDTELPVAWMDYYENRIYVVTFLDSLRISARNGVVDFDQSEFSAKAESIKNRLSSDGFTENKYVITVAPY